MMYEQMPSSYPSVSVMCHNGRRVVDRRRAQRVAEPHAPSYKVQSVKVDWYLTRSVTSHHFDFNQKVS